VLRAGALGTYDPGTRGLTGVGVRGRSDPERRADHV